MENTEPAGKPAPESRRDQSADASGTPANPDKPGPLKNPATGSHPPTGELTPDEQMALYEDDLKETDWGHQPC
jgi:hypothetical protein